MVDPRRLLALACAACAACANPTGDDSAVPAEVPATAHWMGDVYADRQETQVGKVLLPGAFNSTSYACAEENGISPHSPDVVLALWGTEETPSDDTNRTRVVGWAKTQERSLFEQLEDGIGFLELNLTLKDGVITTWHSVYGVPVDVVLDDVVAFAVAWPDEVVVLTFGLDLDAADYPLLADALTTPRAGGASLCDLVYDGAGDAATTSLADVYARGRNLVWAPDGDLRAYLDGRGDCALSNGISDRTWSLTISPQGVEDALTASVDTRDPEHLLVNDFVFSLDGAASILDQANYVAAYPGLKEASQDLGFLGDFPERLIAGHDTLGNMNVFAGAYYEETTLVAAAIAQNGAR